MGKFFGLQCKYICKGISLELNIENISCFPRMPLIIEKGSSEDTCFIARYIGGCPSSTQIMHLSSCGRETS